MKKIMLLLIVVITTASLRAQTVLTSYVAANTRPLTRIDSISSFEEFAPMGKAIGDARIVFLGEQDHGDAAAFIAKTQLINYLHREKGFDVIAFESDFFAGTNGYETVTANAPSFAKYYRANIFQYWTLCDACTGLFTQLIPESFNSVHPFIIAGFDSQMYLRYSTQQLAKAIDSVCRANNFAITGQEAAYKELLNAISLLTNSLTTAAQKPDFYSSTAAALTNLKTMFTEKLGNASQWPLLIENLISLCHQMRLVNKDFTASCNYRDAQMATNLKWLCKEKFAGKKIIVWAANYHVAKIERGLLKKSNDGFSPMAASFIKDTALNKETYVIGFTSYDGVAGRIGTKSFNIDAPEKNGFENWVNNTYDYAFTDFTAFNNQHPEFNTPFALKSSVKAAGVHQSAEAQWNKIFDGLFFIRHMYNCKIKY